jgi:hypothetical protein
MPDGSGVYADFISSLLDAESSRKSSLEQRGIGVVTTSGTLVTLLFGLIAVITSAKSFTLPGRAHGWLVGAAILFIAAAAVGISTNLPLFYGKMIITEQALRDAWHDDVPDAQAAVTAVRLKRLDQAHKVNTAKAWALVAAVCTEVAAAAVLTVGIVEIITHSG